MYTVKKLSPSNKLSLEKLPRSEAGLKKAPTILKGCVLTGGTQSKEDRS